MRCNKAKDYISQDLDAVLPPDATGKLRDHLDTCADCRDFREDLVLGQRLLAATAPELPENFDWKLQLKLNQALQRTAGETRYPWQEDQVTDRWGWLRNFGAATAVGLAAVLALAMVFGPVAPRGNDNLMVANTDSSTPRAGTTDRRPLFRTGNGGLYQPTAQRMVSTAGRTSSGSSSRYLNRGWSGPETEDLITIRRLKVENQRLTNILLQYQRANELMRAQLDTSGAHALDLQHER